MTDQWCSNSSIRYQPRFLLPHYFLAKQLRILGPPHPIPHSNVSSSTLPQISPDLFLEARQGQLHSNAPIPYSSTQPTSFHGSSCIANPSVARAGSPPFASLQAESKRRLACPDVWGTICRRLSRGILSGHGLLAQAWRRRTGLAASNFSGASRPL